MPVVYYQDFNATTIELHRQHTNKNKTKSNQGQPPLVAFSLESLREFLNSSRPFGFFLASKVSDRSILSGFPLKMNRILNATTYSIVSMD